MATATIADRRQAVAALAAERRGQGGSGRFWKRALVALLALACLSLLVMWLLGFFSTPRAVAEVAQIVDQQIVEYDPTPEQIVAWALAPSGGNPDAEPGAAAGGGGG